MENKSDFMVNDFIKEVDRLVDQWKTCDLKIIMSHIETIEAYDGVFLDDIYKDIIEIGYRIFDKRIEEIENDN